MRDYRDAKAMAQTLRQAVKERSLSLTHSESLELIAKILGFADWNVLSARIQGEPELPVRRVAGDFMLATKLPVVPMRDLVLFPQMTTPIFAGRVKSMAAIEQAMATDKQIFFVAQRRLADDDPKLADLYEVGVIADVIQAVKLPNGTIKLMVHGSRRARIVRFEDDETCLVAKLSWIREVGAAGEEAVALSREVLQRFETYANVTLSSPPQAMMQLSQLTVPGRVADVIAQYLSVGIERRQELLETASIIRRLKSILEIMSVDRKAA
jgi:uncharacterized protein